VGAHRAETGRAELTPERRQGIKEVPLKVADVDIAILQQAKAEYTKLP
jgi:hypothetical protein